VPSQWIVKPIDILEDLPFYLTACVPTVAPDQLFLDGFEEDLNHRIVIAISLPAHGGLEAMLGQELPVLVGTILRPTTRMMNAALPPSQGSCPLLYFSLIFRWAGMAMRRLGPNQWHER
jgi:hypothetical protein